MRSVTIIACLIATYCNAQQWEIDNHPNNRRKAIIVDSVPISDYVYTEVSELSEGKAYVAQGDLYAYIDETGKEITPYIFAEANNFTNGYAIVGDSFNRSVLNDRMQLIVPFQFARVRLPKLGLIVVQSHEGMWGAYDVMGNLKLPFIYDLPPNIVELNKIIVRQAEEYGVVNDCNETVYNCAYQYISADGLAYKQGKYLQLF